MSAGGGNGCGDWRPTASRPALELRAALLARTRSFFATRRVLEVDTPILVNAPVTDVHIRSARVMLETVNPREATQSCFFLHTSPEYAMKRLVAAGMGDIYQICHVVRALERGRLHNAEFTLIEWYRLGFSLEALMSEVEALVIELLGRPRASLAIERVSYREVFLRTLHLDPFAAPFTELSEHALQAGFEAASADRDELLELLMGTVIGPRLGQGEPTQEASARAGSAGRGPRRQGRPLALTFVYGYPASQAALARLDPEDARAAQRFELYCEGVELANGFHELACAREQRDRFERDLKERRRLDLAEARIDERLLAALEAGLPDCSGVALGFDRTLMLAAGARSIDAVLPFPIERA